jgi:glycerophosphoryl diester phosphodiesterase
MQRPFIWAHRGASKIAPENTMAAFSAAVELGADGLELDIHLSQDSIPVVIHDESLERTTDGRGLVANASLEQLQQLDAGGWFSPEFMGESLPTLAEVLSEFSGKLSLNLELKEFSAGVEVLSLLRQHPDAEVVISSFDYDLLKGLRSLDEALPLAVLFDDGSWRQAVRLANEISACAFHPADNLVCRRMVAACRKLALPVSVWTVDQESQARSLMRMGVSGFFTNDPDALRSARPALVSSL